MKNVFDTVSYDASRLVTETYSTSFSTATSLLGKAIRQDIYNIYGFVRLADEIVDSFHDYNKVFLFNNFEEQLYNALEQKISLNPILNAFQCTVHKYNIDLEYIKAFMKSMRLDLVKSNYQNQEEIKTYIYGSADVVGLICLQVFVKGDFKQFDQLKHAAMKLGSAFQKVNFLRDLKEDVEHLGRTYFPNINLEALDEASKQGIIKDIEADFEEGYHGIKQLPQEAKFGVYAAYRYYKQLLKKLEHTSVQNIKNGRIRVPNLKKLELLTRSYVKYHLNLL